MLCVLDLGKRGEAIPLGDLLSDGSLPIPAILNVFGKKNKLSSLAISHKLCYGDLFE